MDDEPEVGPGIILNIFCTMYKIHLHASASLFKALCFILSNMQVIWLPLGIGHWS